MGNTHEDTTAGGVQTPACPRIAKTTAASTVRRLTGWQTSSATAKARIVAGRPLSRAMSSFVRMSEMMDIDVVGVVFLLQEVRPSLLRLYGKEIWNLTKKVESFSRISFSKPWDLPCRKHKKKRAITRSVASCRSTKSHGFQNGDCYAESRIKLSVVSR